MSDLQRTVTVADLPVRGAESLTNAWWGVAAVFLVHGLVVSTWVSRIAAVKNSLGIGDGAFGVALLASAIGSLLAIPLCGWAVQQFGSKRTVQWTACGFALTLVPLALSPGIFFLTAALFFYGALAGAYDVAINAQAVGMEKRLGTSTMSRFHAMFSLGGLAGAAAGAAIATAGLAPLPHFAIATALIGGVILTASALLEDHRSPVAKRERARMPSPSAPLVILSTIGFCFFLSEGAIADWTSIYLAESLNSGEGYAAAGYAVFSAAMTIFRLTGDAIANRLGRGATIRLGALLAASGLLIAALAGTPAIALAGFAAVGAGFSSIIPLVFASAGRLSTASEAAGIATVSGIGYVGFLVGPPAIGFLSELFSLRAGLLLLAALSATGALLVSVLAHVTRGAVNPMGDD